MLQEIQFKAELKTGGSIGTCELKKSLKSLFHLVKVAGPSPNLFLIEVGTEFNANYSKAKIGQFIRIAIHLLPLDVQGVKVTDIKEETELYSTNL